MPQKTCTPEWGKGGDLSMVRAAPITTAMKYLVGTTSVIRRVAVRRLTVSGASEFAAVMLALAALLVVLVVWWLVKTKRSRCGPPGPRPWPFIGSLHLLGQHETPFQAFTALSKVYGDVFSITLGSTPCVVVNNFKLIREVLISKGAEFGGRPNFVRFHKLFGGDRNNCEYTRFTYFGSIFKSRSPGILLNPPFKSKASHYVLQILNLTRIKFVAVLLLTCSQGHRLQYYL